MPWNHYLAASVVLSALLVGLCVYVAPLHEPLGTVSLAADELALAALLALVPFALVEAGKAILRRLGVTIDLAAP
jgi:hypothetical protein